MNNVNLRNQNTLPERVIDQITKGNFPHEIVNKIASFANLKPKNLFLELSLISKQIRSTILSDRDYWNSHVIRHWGAENATPENQGLSVPNVLEKIKEYTIKHRLEKSALRYFSLFCAEYYNEFYNEFFVASEFDKNDLFDGNIWNFYNFELSVIIHLLPYLESESAKPSILYLAGRLSRLIFYEIDNEGAKKLASLGLSHVRGLSWLEKAAEKGHMQAAFRLATELLGDIKDIDFTKDLQIGWGLQDSVIRAIKWLQTAADNKHQLAIDKLKGIKNQDWKHVTTIYGHDMDNLSNEVKTQIRELHDLSDKVNTSIRELISKRPLEDSENKKLSVSFMPEEIEKVSIDRLQESALEYFSLLIKYDDPFSLSKKWGYDYQISIILHLSSYIEKGSATAELFYLAGRYGIEIINQLTGKELLTWETNKDFNYGHFISWLERAAKMGHTQAAFEVTRASRPGPGRDGLATPFTSTF